MTLIDKEYLDHGPWVVLDFHWDQSLNALLAAPETWQYCLKFLLSTEVE
jgi:hypothetical protein